MICAFIQARIGSERLRKKVLKDLPQGSGVNMLQHVIRRVKQAKTLDGIVVLSPDLVCCQIASREGVQYSANDSGRRDVLEEFYHAAYMFKPDIIVRITADCPAVMPKTIDKVVDEHVQNKWDLTYNRNDNIAYCSEIDGLDVEVFNAEALQRAYCEATEPADREHVTRYLYDNAVMVESGWHIENPNKIKLSVDTQEDYERMCDIYRELGPDFDMRDLKDYLEKEAK